MDRHDGKERHLTARSAIISRRQSRKDIRLVDDAEQRGGPCYRLVGMRGKCRGKITITDCWCSDHVGIAKH